MLHYLVLDVVSVNDSVLYYVPMPQNVASVCPAVTLPNKVSRFFPLIHSPNKVPMVASVDIFPK